MKYLFILGLYLWSSLAFAVQLTIRGKAQQLLFSQSVPLQNFEDVGNFSVKVFADNQIPFSGDASGISELYHLSQDIEVISDTEMKAYGWCFSIDGQVPETMPDQTELTNDSSSIHWFYAYAHYKDGEWIAQCAK